MNFEEIKKDLETICEGFYLGKLIDWTSQPHSVENFHEVTFNTDINKKQVYYYKNK